jgi:hypothetical protein
VPVKGSCWQLALGLPCTRTRLVKMERDLISYTTWSVFVPARGSEWQLALGQINTKA